MPIRDRDPGAVVHEDEVGADSKGKCDCGTLALVQSRSGGVVGVPIGIRSDLKPSRKLCDPSPHRRRCIGMRKFIVHRPGHENRLEQLGQHIDRFDQDQIIERPGIGDDKPHALLETEPLQVALLALQIVEAVGLKHVMRLQKPVEGIARAKA